MKIQVTMKTSDVLEYAVEEAVRLKYDLDESSDLSDNDDAFNDRIDTLGVCEKWFRYKECVTVEIDTEAGTCVVVPV